MLPVVVWIVLGLIWGSTWLFIKVGLQDLPPFSFAAIRFVIASIPLLLLTALLRRPLSREKSDWIFMVATGFLVFPLNYALVFWGENHISSGVTAILYTTHPIFGFLFARLLLRTEAITWRKIAGVLFGTAGVTLIFWRQFDVAGSLARLGGAAVVIAASGTAFANVLLKKNSHRFDVLVLTTVQMSAGLIPLLMLGLTLEGFPWTFRWTRTAWISVIYLALVGSSIAFLLLYWLMRHIEVTKLQLMPLFSTLVAVILGWLVLNEELTWRIAAGAAAILGGLGLATTSSAAELFPVRTHLKEK